TWVRGLRGHPRAPESHLLFMDLKEFNYALPESLIAAYPSQDRQRSRLLVLERRSGELTDSVFADLENFLEQGDLVVLNDTKVFPARLHGTKASGGKGGVLLLAPVPGRRGLLLDLV